MPRRSIAALLAPLLLLIAATAAPVTQAGGGCHVPDGSVYMEGESSVIRMDLCSFGPTIARVPVGTSVRFLNTSTIEHAVVGRARTFESDILSPGKEFTAEFTQAGTYPFSCPLHVGMVGAIVVGGAAAAQGAPPVISTDADTSSASATSASPTGTDPMPPWLALAAGLGAGAIAGAAAAAWFLTRRRETTG